MCRYAKLQKLDCSDWRVSFANVLMWLQHFMGGWGDCGWQGSIEGLFHDLKMY
jgi:hypothetical protein